MDKIQIRMIGTSAVLIGSRVVEPTPEAKLALQRQIESYGKIHTPIVVQQAKQAIQPDSGMLVANAVAYDLIDGRNRLYAAKALGIKELPAVVYPVGHQWKDGERRALEVSSNLDRRVGESLLGFIMTLHAERAEGQRMGRFHAVGGNMGANQHGAFEAVAEKSATASIEYAKHATAVHRWAGKPVTNDQLREWFGILKWLRLIPNLAENLQLLPADHPAIKGAKALEMIAISIRSECGVSAKTVDNPDHFDEAGTAALKAGKAKIEAMLAKVIEAQAAGNMIPWPSKENTAKAKKAQITEHAKAVLKAIEESGSTGLTQKAAVKRAAEIVGDTVNTGRMGELKEAGLIVQPGGKQGSPWVSVKFAPKPVEPAKAATAPADPAPEPADDLGPAVSAALIEDTAMALAKHYGASKAIEALRAVIAKLEAGAA